MCQTATIDLIWSNHQDTLLRGCLAEGIKRICKNNSFSDRPGLKGLAEITRLSQAVIRALRSELDRNHVSPIKGDVTVCDAILAKIPQLREISLLHMDALAKFKRSQPHLEFPALHKELFSVDSWTIDAAQGVPTLTNKAVRE